ncbi:oligoribonuclease [Parendozoicomonas sp. Alg238-R29]|uniref:oligoribonuclease n=1 Tax=Parendozoicomonas sp. Alg238-R29 TaxID=2993446 RepID=UPI00248DF378|nr:oligoribonuclease [Parendozoicomonas sp. Alg238-R29]
MSAYFVWTDLESGGLNGRLSDGTLGCETLPILEIAIIVTDTDLNEIGEPLRLVVHHDTETLLSMSEWAINTHKESGLLGEVENSTLTLEEAEDAITSYLRGLGVQAYDRDAKTGGIMAGNSIHFDRSFIMAQMPTLNNYLHYRMLDVSAIALAARYFSPQLAGKATEFKQYQHEALADIRESVEELKVYREALGSVDTLFLDAPFLESATR